MRSLDLIAVPSNLGLRPNPDGSLAGTTRAATALCAAGLDRMLDPRERRTLRERAYEREAQPGTRIRNGLSIRELNLELADEVARSLHSGGFPLVIGGECSNLLGCLLGLRREGGRGLIHIDGHSDFFHPGNYDSAKYLGAAAGMDLALATGRGEPTLTSWPGVAGPLVEDAHVIQLGERDREDPAYAYADVLATEIAMVTIQEILSQGLESTIAAALARLEARDLHRAWLHIDVDVLDESIMPAVDSPGTPGLSFEALASLVRGLLASGRIAGADVAIYDPDRDADGACARGLVECLRAFA